MAFHKWWYLRTILKYSHPLISIYEKNKIRKLGEVPSKEPCLFILGAPRTGSTILYQLITDLLDVLYIDNLANFARYNPYFGLGLSSRFYGNQAHHSYKSSFGSTIQQGLHAPAEALFIYKWFPKDHHFTETSDLRADKISSFQNTINAIINRVSKPLVIKNLSFGLRLQVLTEVIPNAKYLVIKRDPLFTAQSIILAKQKNKIPEQKIWGIRPKNYLHLERMDPLKSVVMQVYSIEKQIHDDLKKVSPESILYIDYEKLSPNPELVINEVVHLIGPNVKHRPYSSIPDISISNQICLPENVIESLQTHIGELDWINYNS